MRVPATLPSLDLVRRIDPRRVLVHDLPLKAAAVALAAILWVAAAGSATRDATVSLDHVAVDRPEVPPGYVVRGTIPDVAVKLRGPAGPAGPVGAVGQQELRAALDVATLDLARAEAQELPVRVTVADERVKVVDVSPATVAVRVEPITARPFSVQARFANDPPAGFKPGQPAFAPAEVTVGGPQSLVAQVAAVYANVRFGDVGVDVIQSAQVQAVDGAGKPVDGVSVEPAGVQINVPVLPTATTRTVPIVWRLRGAVASGFWVSRVTTDPLAVTVRGDGTALASLDRIDTAAIDTTGLSASRTLRVALALPPGVALVDPVTVSVTLTVSPLTGTRPFPLIAVLPSGLGQGLAADVEPKTVEVLVSGNVADLLALRPEDVTASVDVAGKSQGSYGVDVAVKLSGGISLVSAQPPRVTVIIRTK